MAKLPVGKIVGRAAIGPLNLSVLGAGVLGGLALGLWPLAALGGVAYTALVATDVVNPRFWKQHLFGRGEPTELPRPERLGDDELRKAVEAILAAFTEIERVSREIPDRVARHVRGTLGSIEEMRGHTARLVARCDELSRFLGSVTWQEALGEADELKGKAARANDPATREQYQLAAAAAAERLRALTDVRTARERILANLSHIGATLRSIPPKLMRVRALDDQATDALTGDVAAEVDRMNIELTAFEQTLSDLVTPPQEEIA